MVAQLQNQDPESPQDGTQFVAQLAQFSSLEQQLDMHSDLDSIKADLTPAAAASTSSSGTTGTGTTTGSSTNASQGS
jgi:flagellar basal-body rod modification protein FlgD